MIPSRISNAAPPVVLSPAAQLDALLHRVGVFRLDDRGWIRVSGPDRVRWLNGMVTNSVQGLKPGDGCYTFVLNPQGRIQGDGYLFAEPDAILFETSRSRLPALLALLDRFVIMDDVELSDVSESFEGIAIAGPGAAAVLSSAGVSVEDQPMGPSMRQTNREGSVVRVIRTDSALVPRFEVWADAAAIASLLNALQESAFCGEQAIEWLSLLEGTPRMGDDIRERDLPQETGQDRALHFAKGCYVGQEIVERIRSRGAVHRAFAQFYLTGEVPAAGTPLQRDGKPVGELTRAAEIPLASGAIRLALGYVRREAIERGEPLDYPGGHATRVSPGQHKLLSSSNAAMAPRPAASASTERA